MPDLTNEDIRAIREMAETRIELRIIAERLGKLPCVAHDIALAELKVRSAIFSGVFGALGGAGVAIVVLLIKSAIGA